MVSILLRSLSRFEEVPPSAAFLGLGAAILMGSLSGETGGRGTVRSVDVEAYAEYASGVSFLERGESSAALKHLETALKLDPRSSAIPALIADVYRGLGNTKRAVELYKLALERNPELPEVHRELGRIYYRQGKTDEAIEQLRQGIRANGKDEFVRFLLASLFRKKGDLKSCAEQYELLLQARPSLVRTSQTLGELYLQIPARLEDAEKAAERAKPGDFLPYFRLAQLCLSSGKSEAAIKALEKAVSIQPEWVAGYEMLGRAYQDLKQFTKAAEALDRASAGHPKRLSILYQVSDIYFVSGNYEAAAEVLERIRQEDPSFRQTLFRLAYAYRALEKWGNVIETARDCLQHQGTHADPAIYELLGSAYLAMGQKKKAYESAIALKDLLRKTEEPKQFVRVARLMATLLGKMDDTRGAIDILEAALKKGIDRGALQLDLASLYDEAGMDDKVVRVLEDVLKESPDNARANNHLGYFFAERGKNLGKAQKLIQRALKADPGNWAYLDSLGWVYYKQGRLKQALEKLEEAIKIQDDAVVRDHLGDVLRAQGKHEDARKQWLRALELDPDFGEVKAKLSGRVEADKRKQTPVKPSLEKN